MDRTEHSTVALPSLVGAQHLAHREFIAGALILTIKEWGFLPFPWEQWHYPGVCGVRKIEVTTGITILRCLSRCLPSWRCAQVVSAAVSLHCTPAHCIHSNTATSLCSAAVTFLGAWKKGKRRSCVLPRFVSICCSCEAPCHSKALLRVPERSRWVVIRGISPLATGESFPMLKGCFLHAGRQLILSTIQICHFPRAQ